LSPEAGGKNNSPVKNVILRRKAKASPIFPTKIKKNISGGKPLGFAPIMRKRKKRT